MRLIFKSTRLTGSRKPDTIVAEDATGILEKWNGSPWYGHLAPREFRRQLLHQTGADPGPEADDDTLLRAVVQAVPELRLDDGGPLASRLS